MKIEEVIRSEKAKAGKWFGKGPAGPWFQLAGDMFRRKSELSIGTDGMAVFVGDFERDDWQFEPEPKPKTSHSEVMGRVKSCFKMLTDLIDESLPKEEGPAP